MQLSDYLTDCRRLLHDATSQYWSDADLTAYINKAIKRVAERCKQVRQLQAYALAAGTDPYTVQYASLPNPLTIDILGISILWGNTRINLKQLPFSILTARYRSWSTYTDVPQCYARYGQGAVVIAPAPNVSYPAEWDTAVYPAPLTNPTDVDVSSDPYLEPVPYHACYLAKLNFQQYDEAEKFRKMYTDAILACPGITMERMVESWYGEDD